MTRDEHMAWCKRRALEYLPHSPQQAVTSMLSDLGKHPETKGAAEVMGIIGLMTATGSPAEARRFIDGFN